MSTSPISELPPGQKRVDVFLTRVAGIAGIAALFVMIYFGVLGINRKALELRYVARVSVVHTDAAVANHVHVAFDSTTVSNLTKLVFRVTNVGQQPIERRDIESPLALEFHASRVLDASVMERSPRNLDVGVLVRSGGVTVSHGLLNPGDSFECGVLLDGDVAGWPTAGLRVSGVSRLSVVTPGDDEARVHAVVFGYSPAIKYGILGVSSLCPLLLLVLVGVAFFDFFSKLLPISAIRLRKKLNELRGEEILDRVSLAVDSRYYLAIRSVLPGIPLEQALDPRILSERLGATLEFPSMSQDARDLVAREAVERMRQGLPRAVANGIFLALPGGADAIARDAVSAVVAQPNETLPDYIARASDVGCTASAGASLRQRWKSVDRSTLAFGPIFLTLAISTSLLVIGCWQLAIWGRQ